MKNACLGIAALAVANAFAAQPGDIILAPAAGGGVTITDATGNIARLRVADDGSVTIPGTIFKGASSFIHTSGTNNTFVGALAGNFALTGPNNTGLGAGTLLSNTTGAGNTAVGGVALLANTTGTGNTAIGYNALFVNSIGLNNTATGIDALHNNTSGTQNAAHGAEALFANTSGSNLTASGYHALGGNTTGGQNSAFGSEALSGNTTGNYNAAFGVGTLLHSTTGDSNTAVGSFALFNISSGTNNIGIGLNAGGSVHNGSFNIYIGATPTSDESTTIRIGNGDQTRAFVSGIRGVTTGSANAIPVMIDSNGQLGTLSSSERFKNDIADMGDASDALMHLRPVTFHYKADQDPAGRTLQYGLIAEEVAQVYPGLVAHSPDGEVETVMYQFLPAMLLNESQKQRRTIERLEAELAGMQDLRNELAAIKRQLGLR